MNEESHRTLSCSLGVREPQIVAFVGAGGKTIALQRLAVELAVDGRTTVVTTTTAMFAHQLAAVGPLLLGPSAGFDLAVRLGEVLGRGHLAALARSLGDDGKALGLPAAHVDALWKARPADYLVVEADGSRGLPLKTFDAHEPQLPGETTTVVVVAGVDALGAPLDEAHVHRARLLAAALGVIEGEIVTSGIIARALAGQVERVRGLVPKARIVVLLNKADTSDLMSAGDEVAELLLEGAEGLGGRRALGPGCPDRVVVGSLWNGVFRSVGEEGAP